jgi:uncharacterized protein CbrC (UPF0167 family)
MASFKYFAAPVAEIFRYSDSDPCVQCGRVAPATLLKRSKESDPPEFCCLECVAAGRSAIEHETEIGFVDRGGLSSFDFSSLKFVSIELPRGFRKNAIAELMRTPDFVSHQGGTFLTHCNDFMKYLGRWEPEDFAGEDGEPSRHVYLAAADDDPELWDATVSQRQRGEVYLNSNWAYGAWCYAFECLHCGTLRCSWDCD